VYDVYDSDKEDRWRYTLGRWGSRPLFTVGLNPSTATREKADTTVAKVERVAQREGFDGFVMLNLYPVRATDYRELPRAVDSVAFETNLLKIEALVASVRRPTVWAAWGGCVSYHSYFEQARDELRHRLERYEPRWVCFGAPTAGGHPRHPSRLQYSWKLEPYRHAHPA
jgi:hypothetical protein